MRKLIIAAGAALVMAGIIAAPAFAAVRQVGQETGDIFYTADYGYCETFDAEGYHDWVGGRYGTTSNKEVTGALGYINAATDLTDCTPTPLWGDGGVSGWSAVVEDHTWEIIQIGVIICENPYDPSYSPCKSHPGDRRIFWAWGRAPNTPGCPSSGKRPIAIDLGPASTGRHVYRIDFDSDSVQGYVDGQLKVGPVSTVNMCWLYNSTNNQAEWKFERWDGGDGSGSSGDHVVFDGIQMRTVPDGSYGGAWSVTPDLWMSSTDSEQHYSETSGNSFQAWTIQTSQ